MAKPKLLKSQNGFWYFQFPKEIDQPGSNFYKAVEYLDYDEYKCQQLLKPIVDKYPDAAIDAHAHLSMSYRNQGKNLDAMRNADRAYSIGKEALSKINEEIELDWHIIPNRPFLRACITYGRECVLYNEINRGIEIYEEALKYEQEDNVGVRYFLLECYFRKKKFKEAELLLQKYEDDAEFLYGKILLELLTGTGNGIKHIKAAFKANKYILNEILGFSSPIIEKEDEHKLYYAMDYCIRYKAILKSKKIWAAFFDLAPPLI